MKWEWHTHDQFSCQLVKRTTWPSWHCRPTWCWHTRQTGRRANSLTCWLCNWRVQDNGKLNLYLVIVFEGAIDHMAESSHGTFCVWRVPHSGPSEVDRLFQSSLLDPTQPKRSWPKNHNQLNPQMTNVVLLTLADFLLKFY